MSPQAPWPDVNKILIEAFAGKANAVVGPKLTVLPTDMKASAPVIRVRRIGGNADELTDFPRVAVDVYDNSYEAAAALAEDLRQVLLDRDKVRTSFGRIDRCDVEVGPIEIPFADPDVRHITATYRLATRR